MRDQFVSKVFRQLLDQGYLHTANNLLVVAGGRAERELFRSLSFTNVTITNLDCVEAAEHENPSNGLAKAQHLSYSPRSFEWVIVVDGHITARPACAQLKCVPSVLQRRHRSRSKTLC